MAAGICHFAKIQFLLLFLFTNGFLGQNSAQVDSRAHVTPGTVFGWFLTPSQFYRSYQDIRVSISTPLSPPPPQKKGEKSVRVCVCVCGGGGGGGVI